MKEKDRDKIEKLLQEWGKDRAAELQQLLMGKDYLGDEEFFELCIRVRGEHMIREAINSALGRTNETAIYAELVRRSNDAIESHYRILQAQARTRILTEPQREFVSVDKETRKAIRSKLLRLVS